MSKSWVVKWLKRFWTDHGERFVFGGLSLIFAVFFIFQKEPQLKGAGYAILVGLAMTCYNKARGGKPMDEEDPPPYVENSK